MKDYINLFHAMVSRNSFWEDLLEQKIENFIFLMILDKIDHLLDYFE